ncbi:MAG: hypothetical protein KZQ60_18240, partial [Candidatus Thiodiazotropha sp. (ex Lucinoma aequizonata)]|nr:hypothetical protein [Candidatus Thiodiazotropha sp. (ex Lucinoma aequizonata)]
RMRLNGVVNDIESYSKKQKSNACLQMKVNGQACLRDQGMCTKQLQDRRAIPAPCHIDSGIPPY